MQKKKCNRKATIIKGQKTETYIEVRERTKLNLYRFKVNRCMLGT